MKGRWVRTKELGGEAYGGGVSEERRGGGGDGGGRRRRGRWLEVARVDVKRWADRAQANADVALETSAKEREWQRPQGRAAGSTG